MPTHRRQSSFDLHVLDHSVMHFFERRNADEQDRTGTSDSGRAISERRNGIHDMRNAGTVACLAVQVDRACQGWRERLVQIAFATSPPDAADGFRSRRSGGSCSFVPLQPRIVVRPGGDSLGTGGTGDIATTIGADDCPDTVPSFVDPSTNRSIRAERESVSSLACGYARRLASARLRGPLFPEGARSVLFVELHGCSQPSLRYQSHTGTGKRAGDQNCVGKLVEIGDSKNSADRQRADLLRQPTTPAWYGGVDSTVPSAWGGALFHSHSRAVAQRDYRTIQQSVGL